MEELKKQQVLEQIIQEVHKSSFVAIAGHVSPDGDAVASCLALAMSISKLNKQVVILLEEIPARYASLRGQEFLNTAPSSDLCPDLFICCDCGSKERMGRFEEIFDKTYMTVVIDHHVSNVSYGKINYVDFSAASTSEMVYDVIELMGNMDMDIASALYTGIIFDTGGLRFNSTSPRTVVKVSKLMEMGIPFNAIYTEAMLSHTYTEAMIFSKAVSKMKFMDGLPVIYSFLTKEDMDSVNATRKDLEGIVEYLLNTKGAEVSVFVSSSSENESKASFRSLTFNVNAIASNWGGGGHINAAGATVSLPPAEALAAILEHIAVMVKKLP